MRYLLPLLSLAARLHAADPRIALDHEFPDPEGAKEFAGELILVEHVNRRGILRFDRDGTINKYFWDLPHHFQMLPYGAIWYRGAPAELKDIPLGTRLRGKFHLGPKGPFEVKPPVSGYVAGKMARPDLRSIESQYSRAFLLEDDFSFRQRQGHGWKIISVKPDRTELATELVALATGAPIVPKRKLTLRIDSGTRVWRGRGFATLDELATGQVTQMNLGWYSLLGSYRQDALCRDIWIDEESRQVATEQQRGIHRAHMTRRGVPALITKTEHEPGAGAKGWITLQINAGVDRELIDHISRAKQVVIRPVEENLRPYDINGNPIGHVEETVRIETPPAGSSGVELRLLVYEMVEGHRAGRSVRLIDRDWNAPDAPREEKLWPNDSRIFSVGPRHIADRDGPPETGQNE